MSALRLPPAPVLAASNAALIAPAIKSIDGRAEHRAASVLFDQARCQGAEEQSLPLAVHSERTAPARNGSSVPTRLAAPRLKGSILDYGAGRGEDSRWLRAHGRSVTAYDPFFFPEKPAAGRRFDWVLLNYVLNVIESPRERQAVLRDVKARLKAGGPTFGPGGRLLVAVRGAREIESSRRPSWRRRGDGWMTPRGTFQRGFTSAELNAALGRAGLRVLERLGRSLPPEIVVAGAAESAPAFGKQTPVALYFHRSLQDRAPEKIAARVARAGKLLPRGARWNLVKADNQGRAVSFLWYPEFDSDPHPALRYAYRVDLKTGRVAVSDHRGRENPFILHRKDSMVGTDYPLYEKFRALTEKEEARGLLGRPDIGTRRGWTAILGAAFALPAASAAGFSARGAFSALLTKTSPFLEIGAMLVGTYAAIRGARWIIDRIAAGRGLERHTVAAWRLATNVVLWTAGAAGVLYLGGAPQELIATVFGAGGTILSLALSNVLGNLIHGLNFLLSRPYTVGDKVRIDDDAGTVRDFTLTTVLGDGDNGGKMKTRYAALAAKIVIVEGRYRIPTASLRLAAPLKPRLAGALRAVWSALSARFWISAAALAALLAAPLLVGALSSGWAATTLFYGVAASIAVLTRQIELALVAVVDKLAEANAWPPELSVMARLGARAGAWLIGGSAALLAAGVSWTALAASLGLTTIAVGLASNSYFGAIVSGAEFLMTRPFVVGDEVQIGKLTGTVLDMTFNHVVVGLDADRYALIPYAVILASLVKVLPRR